MNLEKNTEILLESFLDTNGMYKLLSQLRKKLVQLLKRSLYNISKGGHCHTLTAEELDKSKLFTNSNTPPVVRVIPTGQKKEKCLLTKGSHPREGITVSPINSVTHFILP